MGIEANWLAIETGGTKVIARITRDNQVVREGRWPTSTPAQLVDQIADFVGTQPLGGGGMAAFGPIIVDPASPRYGEVLATPKPGWTGSNVRAALSARLGVPICVDTDVNAAALAEAELGAGRLGDTPCTSLAYVTIGTGIGAGLVRDGVSLRGRLHPEFGHVPVVRLAGDGVASQCPFHPHCVEGLAAGPAVQLRTDGAELAGSAQFQIVADYIGQLFATMVLTWSPDRIVAGGGVMQVPGLRTAAAQAMVRALGGYGVADGVDDLGFVTAPILADAGLEGALILARRGG